MCAVHAAPYLRLPLVAVLAIRHRLGSPHIVHPLQHSLMLHPFFLNLCTSHETDQVSAQDGWEQHSRKFQRR